MSLPFNLQKLPPEALDVLRYLGQHASASIDDLQQGTGIASRSIGKAIRRLVNYDYISMAGDGTYQLTTDGTLAVQQIAAYDATAPGAEVSSAVASAPKQEAPPVERRLTVVVPRSLVAGRAADLYVGINPPSGADKLPGVAHLELKVGAVGGVLSASSISLDVPPDAVAKPVRLRLIPAAAQSGRIVRVRIDAFQAFEFDNLEALGGMYFDLQVSNDANDAGTKDAATRAVGMAVRLKPPR